MWSKVSLNYEPITIKGQHHNYVINFWNELIEFWLKMMMHSEPNTTNTFEKL